MDVNLARVPAEGGPGHRVHLSSLTLLSRLWLHEPNRDDVARAAGELGLPSADPAELAPAYTDLFLLNVYPYSTIFTDPNGELNGADAQRLTALYSAHGYHPDELQSVGAPDHLGLCLGFLAHAERQRLDAEHRDFVNRFLGWAPVCCLAIEYEPSAHDFYRALAAQTRETLLAKLTTSNPHASRLITNDQLPISDLPLSHSEDEVRLHDIIRFLLAPARCGVFLSRARLGQLAREMGLRLPFGSRFEVAERLFSAAGESERIDQLLAALQAEIEAWAAQYRRWVETCERWRPHAEVWLGRTAQVLRTLAEMRQIAEAISP